MDKLSVERRSANMARIKSKDTKPEMVVRKLTHSLGYRYRLHRKDLPGKPDLVFPRYKAAIFVHGCFWHQHPDPTCKDGVMPKSRIDYWAPKLGKNQLRDIQNISTLEKFGWKSLIIWECEVKDITTLKNRIENFLNSD